MLNRHILQLIYGVRAFAYLPITFIKRVVLGRDPYWKQFFWNKWGFMPQELLSLTESRKTIWIDALGGGEVTQIVTFCRLLRNAYPDYAIILSTNNFFPFHFVKNNIPEIDFVFDIPWDISFVTRRVLKKIHPEILIIIDQVRFPAILKEAKKMDIKTVVISAALAGDYYYSTHMIRAFAFGFFRYLDYIGVTEERDKIGYAKLGTQEEKIRITGNMKYDLDYLRVSEDKKDKLRKQLYLSADDFIFVAGSIHPREEVVIFQAYQKARQQLPRLKLIVAPRYLNTLPIMEKRLKSLGINYIKRTQMDKISCLNDAVILVDTFGELSQLYSLASAIFIGNSIFPRDRFALGQNIIEPLVQQRPIFFGKFMNKWKDIVGELKQAWRGLEINTTDELFSGLVRLYRDKALYSAIEDKSKEIVNRNRDGIVNNLQLVRQLLNNKL
jgi:3-deoxy-D-manno-octulosonic-acid transferase